MSDPMPMPDRLLSVEETAGILNTSEKTIWRRIKAGELAVIRDGRLVRVHPDDVRRYISRHRFG